MAHDIRSGPDWPEKCRPFPRRESDGNPVETREPRANPRGHADGGTAAVSLYEAGKRLGLMDRSRRNWTDLLNPLCFRGGIEVRYEVDGIPAIRESDLPRLKTLVDRHFARPRTWPRKAGKSARPGAVSSRTQEPRP